MMKKIFAGVATLALATFLQAAPQPTPGGQQPTQPGTQQKHKKTGKHKGQHEGQAGGSHKTSKKTAGTGGANQ